jgi:hypothetical protein
MQTAPTGVSYRKLTPIVLPDDYKCPDPDPELEDGRDMQQAPTIDKSGYFVARHFAGRPDVLVRTDGFVYYNQYDMNYRFRPDLYVASGVEADAIRQRNGYVIWEAGKPPDFALEVASETTNQRDTGEKTGLYASVGIAEYWRVDPTGGELYGYALAGDVLVDGIYHPIDLHTEEDGTIWGYSGVLDLCLCWNPSWDWDVDDESHLRFFDRKTSRYLCDISLVEAERDEAAAERDTAAAERDAAAAERDAAVADLQQARERIRQLETKLTGPETPDDGAG